jgi:hypothetical protein
MFRRCDLCTVRPFHSALTYSIQQFACLVVANVYTSNLCLPFYSPVEDATPVVLMLATFSKKGTKSFGCQEVPLDVRQADEWVGQRNACKRRLETRRLASREGKHVVSRPSAGETCVIKLEPVQTDQPPGAEGFYSTSCNDP